MDVTSEVLEELKCSTCSVYLSRGPVYLQHNGAAICGRCHKPQHSAIRNKTYESVARLLRFPCKNRDLGCLVSVPFAEETEEIPHEEVCEYRQYVCPLVGSARCEWLGTRNKMLEHCRGEHPELILDNPCNLTHDIAKSSLHNYIITAFNLLFLLHTKVCVTTGKIFHSVRFLGASNEADEFNYTLNIRRNNEMLTKEGRVAPQGCLAIQEDTSLALSTNSLLDVLGGWDSTSFTLTLNRLNLETCIKCNAQAEVLLFGSKKGWWLCKQCAPAKRACVNHAQGCRYEDIDMKCKRHEQFYCDYKSVCKICSVAISEDTLSAHYEVKHVDIICRTGSRWHATPEINKWHQRHFQSSAGTVICWYSITNVEVFFYLYIPVTIERFREFKCSIRIMQSTQTRTYSSDISYDTSYDWLIRVKKSDFSTWRREFDVCVDITKIDL